MVRFQFIYGPVGFFAIKMIKNIFRPGLFSELPKVNQFLSYNRPLTL